MHLGKMNSRVREDEKHEMIIRKLLKNTDNKRCINCGSLGPQYVCTNFSIFVCTYCSGAHREFSHRIKSISMAKFTPGEVANLQSGGNGRAREIYLKELDLVRNPLPDSSDSIKLRNFIKHVYVERRYTGERPAPSRSQDGSREENDYGRPEMPKPGLQSPSRDEQVGDRRPNDRFNDRARKSDVGGYQNDKRSPNRPDTERPPRKSYDDREGRRDERANPDATRDRAKPPVRPFSFRNSDDDPPPVRSVKEILGDDAPTLRVDFNGRSIPGRIPAPGVMQNNGRSQSLEHVGNGEAKDAVPAVKRISSDSMISLIDFGADPEPVVASTLVSDPFAPPPVSKQVFDPFAPASVTGPGPVSVPVPANAPGLDLFGSDPFAVTTISKSAADPFAPASTSKQGPDHFGFGGQGTGGGSATPNWATFDFTGNMAPPEGYPGALPSSTATNNMAAQFSGGAAWDSSSSAGSGGWSAFGLQPEAPPALVASSAPAPVAASSSQVNMFSSIEVHQTNITQSSMQMQMGLPPQPSPAEKLQAPVSASGRVRRELPQDFFAQPGAFGMDPRQDLAFSVGAGHMGAPQFQQRGQQVATQPSRTRNPFDDDDPPPAPFNMGSMQAALPQVGDPLSGLASQWGQSSHQYQPTAAPAGGYGYGMQSNNNLHQQNGQAGAFAQNQGFNQGPMYGGSPFYSQTAGSNPFG